MNHGLSERTVTAIRTLMEAHPEVEKALVYGSRAKGNYRTGSDIDLTLVGDRISAPLLSKIYWELDDLDLPYKIDISLFSKLHHPKLIEHIRRVGIPIYERKAISIR